ncbi:DUF4259 domain-containing protein [Micromonospora sp. NPDC049559]|uniref:DUF4259 domain-containing protein n=1 Tax=Micromonospora sp. NPDC049559 TaxID=3155923 RepID=UPI00341580DB
MGSWGHGPFDDDTSMDFVDHLAELPPDEVVPALLLTIDQLVSGDRQVEDYTLCVQGVAAAALLAGCVPESHEQWPAAAALRPTAEVAIAALRAVDTAYADDSILTEMATEDGNLRERLAAVEPIRQLLRAASYPAAATRDSVLSPSRPYRGHGRSRAAEHAVTIAWVAGRRRRRGDRCRAASRLATGVHGPGAR